MLLQVQMKGEYNLELEHESAGNSFKQRWNATRPTMSIDNIIFGKLTIDVNIS